MNPRQAQSRVEFRKEREFVCLRQNRKATIAPGNLSSLWFCGGVGCFRKFVACCGLLLSKKLWAVLTCQGFISQEGS